MSVALVPLVLYETCFSLCFQNNFMENRKAVLELKDVPPPPLHHASSSSSSSQPFSLAPLPMPPPCLPPPQLTQDSQQQQEGASPKVSIWTRRDVCRADGCGLSGAGGAVCSSGVSSSGSIAGVVSVYVSPGSVAAPTNSSSYNRTSSCSVVSSVHQYNHSLSGQVLDPLLSLAYKPQMLSSVATSQPISSHPYTSCCSGLQHSYPSVPLPCSQPSGFTSSAPPASSLRCLSSLPSSLHGSCLASSAYYTCGVDCCPSVRRAQRCTLGDHPATTTITTTSTSAHFCSNPLHLNVERTVCVKGAHYCQDCLLQVSTCEQVNLMHGRPFCTMGFVLALIKTNTDVPFVCH